MKIILNENQFKLLLEQGGFDEFAVEVSEKYPDSVYLLRFISDFVKKSGCQKIDIEPLKYGAFGLSLVDRVVINKKSL